MLIKIGGVALAILLIAGLAGGVSSEPMTSTPSGTLVERVRVLERSQDRLCELLKPDYGDRWIWRRACKGARAGEVIP
jgi:hypothetical protein